MSAQPAASFQREGGVIQARQLVKRFGGLVAVDHVDLTIEPGGITALIGPNGAGKSTLFNLICGQARPDEGFVTVDGVDVTGKPPHTIARHGVARGFQDVRLFPDMTVLANVMVYAQPPSSGSLFATVLRPMRTVAIAKRSRRKAIDLLEYLSIGELADVRSGSLGFAQQKLGAMARLLALEPRVLMLDEPGSGLDHSGQELLARAISKVASSGMTVCFVEHNMNMVRKLATRVVFLAQGRILADGSVDEVFSHSGLAEAYLGVA